MLSTASMRCSDLSFHDALELGGHGWNRLLSDGHLPVPPPHDHVDAAEARVRVGILDAGVGAAALPALERRARHRLAHREETQQVDGRMPAGIVLAVALHPDGSSPRPELRELGERRPEIVLAAG